MFDTMEIETRKSVAEEHLEVGKALIENMEDDELVGEVEVSKTPYNLIPNYIHFHFKPFNCFLHM